jgi:hypothetical protein
MRAAEIRTLSSDSYRVNKCILIAAGLINQKEIRFLRNYAP